MSKLSVRKTFFKMRQNYFRENIMSYHINGHYENDALARRLTPFVWKVQDLIAVKVQCEKIILYEIRSKRFMCYVRMCPTICCAIVIF